MKMVNSDVGCRCHWTHLNTLQIPRIVFIYVQIKNVPLNKGFKRQEFTLNKISFEVKEVLAKNVPYACEAPKIIFDRVFL